VRRDRDPLADPERLVRRVYAYVAYRIGDGPDAEDVTSTVFERALRYRSSFDSGKGDPLAWLLGIARRCLDDAWAAGGTFPLPKEELAAPGDLEAETVMRLRLAALIAQLDERDQELLALRYGAELSPRAIGELLDLERGAVDVALHRARARLRRALEEDETTTPDQSSGRRAAGS
jgi:RNA polymerase sigma-70 factor, ECF subfamily